MRARWYDPATGRFTTRDPFRGLAGYPQTQHPYVYVHNNPINLTDHSGEVADILWDAAMVLIDVGFMLWDALNPCLDQGTREQLLRQDFLFMLADTAAFFIPFLPGGGGAIQLGRGTAALARVVVHVPEAVRVGVAVQKGVQVGTHLAEASKGGSNSNKGNTGGTSHTVVQKNINKQNIRIDIEFPTGGSSGNVHIHIDKLKIYLDSVNDIRDLPKSIRKDSDIQRAIGKAFDLLSRH